MKVTVWDIMDMAAVNGEPRRWWKGSDEDEPICFWPIHLQMDVEVGDEVRVVYDDGRNLQFVNVRI